ncbi:hypothetical protein [Roseivirga sp. E12]|uniref:hypothetical protein n=1 Tax=Roseivirga sp. E12 TaxID=2819237 RepID=UPI001ABC9516|nr:hypothetical protein [Roseivirga sp. E12]MBO3698073.1 hypothetical protein [Roseivirga sp. E12]
MKALATSLESKYNSTILTTDPSTGDVSGIVFSGDQVKLSTLVNQFPPSGGLTLSIYANKLIADIPELNAETTVIVAREIDLTEIGDASWPIAVPSTGNLTSLECLIQGSVNSGDPQAFNLITSETKGSNPAPLYTVPTNGGTLKIGLFQVEPNNTATGTTLDAIANFEDLLWTPYALNSLYACFAKASSLMNAGDVDSLQEANKILAWVCTAISACGTIPSTHEELFAQASSLVISLNAPGDYQYVAPLSASYYGSEVNSLITAVQDYDSNLESLENAVHIEEVLEEVSTAIESTAATELAPLQTEYGQSKNAIESLYNEYISVIGNFDNAMTIAKNKNQLLQAAIDQAKVSRFINDGIRTAVDAVKSAANIAETVEGKGDGAAEALSSALEAIKQGYETIKGITEDYGQNDLVEDAKALVENNKQLFSYVMNSQQLWYDINNPENAHHSVNFNPEPVTLDPGLAWDNFMTKVTNVLSNLSDELGDNHLKSAQPAGNDYLASLQVVANYGKALNTKIVAYGNQLCKAVVLRAKVHAIKNTTSIWNKLSAKSESKKEKLLALEGLVRNRRDSTMRSIFVEFAYYKDVFFYNNLVESSVTISLDSTPAELTTAFSTINNWVGGLSNGSTNLPSKNTHVSLEIPIVKDGSSTSGQGLVATQSSDSKGIQLTFSIPTGLAHITQQLPHPNSAIWVKSAKYFVKGVLADDAGVIPITISTSGKYSNGFGTDTYKFVSNSLNGGFAYKPGDNGEKPKVTSPFNVGDNYLLPTPFTLWTINIPSECDASGATFIQLELEVNLLSQS